MLPGSRSRHVASRAYSDFFGVIEVDRQRQELKSRTAEISKHHLAFILYSSDPLTLTVYSHRRSNEMATDDIIEKLEAMSMKAGPSRPRPAAKPKAPPIPYQPTSDPSTDEQTSVHDVYEAIAPHFSLTRYKPWPMIASFLASIPAGSIGLDSGAGNGKYIPSARANGLEMIPMDRSEGLLGFAKSIPAFYAGRGEEGEYWRANEVSLANKGASRPSIRLIELIVRTNNGSEVKLFEGI